MDDMREVPEYFLCPVSLQIMKEPVTTVTGITYDRESIERWLSSTADPTCPLTHEPLPRDSMLTPNHTLARLIQAWMSEAARTGNNIVSPSYVSLRKAPPISKACAFGLIHDLGFPEHRLRALEMIGDSLTESKSNRKRMEDAGAVDAIISLIIKCFKEDAFLGVDQALKILNLLWKPTPSEAVFIMCEDCDLMDCLTWVLGWNDVDYQWDAKTCALVALDSIAEAASACLMERINPEIVEKILRVLREKWSITQRGIKAALHVLLKVCNCGRNRLKIVRDGGVFELIELELLQEKPQKRITELIFSVLAQLCSCPEGRAQFVEHAASIAMVTKRLLRVSAMTDDRAIYILGSLSQFSSTYVLREMLRVGAVSKLCMVLQADAATYMKDKAREILRLHSGVWHDSPCIAVYLLTRYQR